MTDQRRFLVAQAPMFWPGEKKARCLPIRVAVYPWTMPEHALTVIVRATIALGSNAADDRAAFIDPTPFSLGEKKDGVRLRPDDFVPLRPALDLVVVGNVDMAGAPVGGIWARRGNIGFGEMIETVVVACSAPGRVPLRPPYTRWLDGKDAELGPGAASATWTQNGAHPDGFDFDVYQTADGALQFFGMPVGEPLVLDGLLEPEKKLETPMPQIAPRLFFDPAQPEDDARDIVLRLDTVVADVDRRVVDLTWRGFLGLRRTPRAAVDRLIIGWVRPAEWKEEDAGRTWKKILRELPRGTFFNATEQSDVERGVEPEPLTEEELTMARYASWDQAAAATPELDMETRAKIAAELAEQREPREQVLFRYGLDEHGWSLEERATVEELAATPSTPAEAARHKAYGETFVRVQDSLARPEEDRVTVADFARIVAAAEQGTHEKVLRDMNLGLGAIFRLDRKWQKKAAADPAIKRELEDALEKARADAAASPRPELEGADA